MNLLIHPLKPYQPDKSYWFVPRKDRDNLRALCFMLSYRDEEHRDRVFGVVAGTVRFSMLFRFTHKFSIPLTVDLSHLPAVWKSNFRSYYLSDGYQGFWLAKNYPNVSVIDEDGRVDE